MTDTIAAPEQSLRAIVDQLQTQNTQLARALESRVVIEQAKGVLAERYSLRMDASFDLLRRSARTNRVPIHELAARVVNEQATPIEVALALAKPVSGRR